MGVHGLTSYIQKNSSLYFKPYELSDCCVIIDGSNTAHVLLFELKSHSVFGGDYDEYSALVRSFALALKKCNIYPIVLMDGGCDKMKIKSRLDRKKSTVLKLKSYCQGFSTEKFFPLFMHQVFVSVMREMGILCIQCNLEADGDIAAVAKKFNFPVLSRDSDYFIYDVLYIPTTTVDLNPVKYPNSKKYYLKCSIYNVDEFLKDTGIDKSLLPVLATLLGNDHIENTVFLKFFNHLKMPKEKNQSHAQKRIRALMHWFKNENYNTAVDHILSHLKKKNIEKVLKIFDKVKNDYTINATSSSVLNKLIDKFGEIDIGKNDLNINWPSEITELYAQGFLPGFSANMILHQLYFTPIQVENIYDQSSHSKSLNFIKKIYATLMPYSKTKKPLALYLISKGQYTCMKIDADPSDCINLDEVLQQPWEERLQLLCDTISVSKNDLVFVPCNSWAIFMMSFIYWIREFNNSVTLAHIHAFVIMMIANQIVQPSVGYYRNSPEFMKNCWHKLKNLKEPELMPVNNNNFKEMLKNVKFYECVFVQKELIPLRRTTEEGSGKQYSLPTIHLFNSFQSCLYYVMVINCLLNFPLPHLKVQDFYSGTLLFNLYINIKSESSVEKFGSKLFLKAPNINRIYTYLIEKLTEVSEVAQLKTRAPKKKTNKKKKRSSLRELEHICCSTDEESEFEDENNSYAFLRKIKP